MKTLRIVKTSAFGNKRIYFENYTSALNALILANHIQPSHPDISTEFQAYGGKNWYTVGIANNGNINFKEN